MTFAKAAVAGFCLVLALSLGVFFGVGYYLSPQSRLVKSDVIVAISGGDTSRRADEAIALWQQGWAPKVIFSGAAQDPQSPSNALVMKRRAMTQGVPAEAVIIDEVSDSTLQNALRVAEITRERQFHQIILVTSPYHQRRAYLVFREHLKGVAILNHSSPDEHWRRGRWWASPTSVGLTLSELQKIAFLKLADRSD